MQIHKMVSIEDTLLNEAQAKGLKNLSAFLDSCLSAYVNGHFKNYKCSGCGITWSTPIQPAKCIFCKADAVHELSE